MTSSPTDLLYKAVSARKKCKNLLPPAKIQVFGNEGVAVKKVQKKVLNKSLKNPLFWLKKAFFWQKKGG